MSSSETDPNPTPFQVAEYLDKYFTVPNRRELLERFYACSFDADPTSKSDREIIDKISVPLSFFNWDLDENDEKCHLLEFLKTPDENYLEESHKDARRRFDEAVAAALAEPAAHIPVIFHETDPYPDFFKSTWKEISPRYILVRIDPNNKDTVVKKVLWSSSRSTQHRVLREISFLLSKEAAGLGDSFLKAIRIDIVGTAEEPKFFYISTRRIYGITLYDVFQRLLKMRQDTKEKNLSNFETFGEDVIETVICQVFTAIIRLNRKFFLHRDLHLSNVLVTPTGIVIIDFGNGKAIQSLYTVTRQTATFYAGYAAAELVVPAFYDIEFFWKNVEPFLEKLKFSGIIQKFSRELSRMRLNPPADLFATFVESNDTILSSEDFKDAYNRVVKVEVSTAIWFPPRPKPVHVVTALPKPEQLVTDDERVSLDS